MLDLRIIVGLLCLATMTIAQDNNTDPMDMDLETRFNDAQASGIRRRHFYCLGVNEENFPPPAMESANSDQITSFQWAIFLQYPVLSYLDSQRKGSLFSAIANIVRESGNSALQEFSEQDFCVGQVTHYSVADYEESVLLNMYFQGDTVISYENMMAPVSIVQFQEAFQTGFEAQAANADSLLVQSFEGRSAIIVNVPEPGSGMTETELNQHPGLISAEDNDDPTRRAVYLGSFATFTTIEDALRNRRPFASNPNPTNFGLEAGDIVFAVFGSLFLTAVGILTLLGFCIHPFFLA